jgi:hypothetical protein
MSAGKVYSVDFLNSDEEKKLHTLTGSYEVKLVVKNNIKDDTKNESVTKLENLDFSVNVLRDISSTRTINYAYNQIRIHIDDAVYVINEYKNKNKNNIYNACIPNSFVSFNILYEKTKDHVSGPSEKKYLLVENCTKLTKSILEGDGIDVFDIKTVDAKRIFEQHKKYPNGGQQEPTEFMIWTRTINGYMMERYGLKNYIDDDDFISAHRVFNIVNSDALIISDSSARGTIIRHSIWNIHDHDKLSLHFAVLKLVNESLEKTQNK